MRTNAYSLSLLYGAHGHWGYCVRGPDRHVNERVSRLQTSSILILRQPTAAQTYKPNQVTA